MAHRCPLGPRFRFLTFAFLYYSSLVLSPAAWALPTEGVVVGGVATIKQPNAQTLHIEQVSERALLDWQGFPSDWQPPESRQVPSLHERLQQSTAASHAPSTGEQ